MDPTENKTKGRKMCAVFPTPELDMIENDLKNLKIEAEEAFCFEQYEKAMVLLENYENKNKSWYGVRDIGFEYGGLYAKSLGVTLVSKKTVEEDEERSKFYCSKILVANAIRETQGRHGTRGSSILKFLREAFEDYWTKHGLYALPTLLVQRQYYMELVTQGQDSNFRISENAKKRLVHNLKSKLGANHKLLLDLPNKLGLSDSSSISDFTIAEIAFDDYLGRALQRLEAGAPDLACHILLLECNSAMLELTAWDKKIWRALTLKATAHHVMGEKTKGFASLHLVKEFLNRFQATKVERAELKKQMRDLGYIDDFKLDLERVEEARDLLFSAYRNYYDDQTVLIRAKERLAKVLLETFRYDEAFRLLMQVYEEKAAALGHCNGKVKAVLDTMCSPDLTREFLSFPVLKELKAFFKNLSFVLPLQLPRSDRTLLKANFFLLYLSAIVDDRVVQGVDKMKKVRDEYARQHGKNHGDVRFFDSMIIRKYEGWCKVEVAKYALSLFPQIIRTVQNRYDYVVRCSQLLTTIEVDSPGFRQSVYDIIQQFYLKACKDLKPQDPIILTILKTAWIIIDKQRSRDVSLLKEASDRLNKILGPLHPVAIKATLIYCNAEYTKFVQNISEYNPDVSPCEEVFKNATQVFGPDHEVTIKAEQVLGRALAVTSPTRRQEAKTLLLSSTHKLKTLIEPFHPHTIFFNHCKIVGHSFYLMGATSAAIEHVRLWKAGLEDKYGYHKEIETAKSVLKGLQNRRPGAFSMFKETAETQMLTNNRDDLIVEMNFPTPKVIKM